MISPEPVLPEDAARDDALLSELRAAASPPLADDPGAALEDPPSSPSPPPIVPGFTLLRELQRGGQGVVWLARQHEPPREVALKLLHPRGRASTQARGRFEREAELAARLRHPHVVTVYASGCADGIPWCAMELVEGVPLDEWLRAHAPPRRARLELFAKIARAVAHAHGRGVLHRDLKPANVLIDAEGAPHVLDFGIARALEPQPGEANRASGRSAAIETDTSDGEFVGTLAYAAPEQVAGEPADTRTDVHALGAILLEMVSGKLPYDVAGGLAAAVARLAHAPPCRARDADPSIDGELAAVIDLALAKEPAARYASAEALADDVDHLLRGEPVAARGHGAWYVLRKALARRRRTVALVAAALLLIAAGVFALVRERIGAALSARTATDVRAVLLDLLEAARPDRMGGSVPLPEILAEAAKRLDGRLDAVPDVRAELLLAIGETYSKLQRDDDAAPHLRAALVQARRAGDPLLIARALVPLGTVLSDRDEAKALLEEAVATRERELGVHHALTAQARSALALTLDERYHDPEPERAEALQRAALADLLDVSGPRDPEVVRSRLRLGRLLAGKRDDAAAAAEAEQQLREAVARVDDVVDADPGLASGCLHACASFFQVRGRFDEAHALLERGLAITRARFGEEQEPEVLRRFARLHYAKGDYQTSESVSRQALGEELTHQARRRPELAARVASLCAALWDGSKPAPWLDSFEVLREARGDGSYETAGWMNGIALLCIKQERRDVAEQLLEGALKIHCRVFGDECPIRKRTLELLAQLRPPARDAERGATSDAR